MTKYRSTTVADNLPVDVMRSKISGGKILAVGCSSKKGEDDYLHFEGSQVGIVEVVKSLMNRRSSKYSEDHSLLNIFNTMDLVLSIASKKHKHKMILDADYYLGLNVEEFGLFEYKPYKKIIDIGYNPAIETLTSIG